MSRRLDMRNVPIRTGAPLVLADDDDAPVVGTGVDHSMNAVEFLRATLPSSGLAVIGTFPHKSKKHGGNVMHHQHFDRIEDAAGFAISKREETNVYFWTHTTKESVEKISSAGRLYKAVERTAGKAAFVKCFYADLDVGDKPGAFTTKVEAITDLKTFCKATGMPKPLVVDSGRGFHIYWIFTQEVPSTEWKPAAEKLKRLAAYHGLKADPAVTADAARVLRVPCTFNRKDPANPIKVIVATRGAASKPFSDLVAIIERASAEMPSSGLRKGTGTVLKQPAASTVPETPANVETVRAMLGAIDPDLPRPTWRNVGWGVAALGWSCGRALARDWSATGKTFDEGEFGKVWDSFDPARAGGIGVGTLVRLATKSGYAGPGLTKQSGIENLGSGTGGIGLANVFDGASSPDATGDIANAERLACDLRGSWLWIEDEGAWVRFSPAAGWLKVAETEALNEAVVVATDMRRRAREALAEAAHDDASARKALLNVERTHKLRDLKNAIEIAKAKPGLWASRADFDADPMLLAVRNGVLDLRTGELKPFAPELRVSKRAAVTFDPAADYPLWKAFLGRVLPDREVRAFLRRWAGYCLTGDVGAHKWVFLFGSGANGKSVFTETLAHIMGDYAHPLATEVLMDDPRGGRNHDPDIMALQGKRLACATETEDDQRLASARVKRLTGGDTLSGRRPYDRAPASFPPSHKLMLMGNHRPVISDASRGTWRRVAIVEFGVEIPEQERDPDLPSKLRAEAAGILNWALAGLVDFQAGGLSPPPAVTAATDEYQRDEDVLGQFLAERCELSDEFKVAGAELYGAFGGWCADNGRKHVRTKTWLTRQLRGRRVTFNRGDGTYLGLRLTRRLGGPFPVT